MNWADLVTRYRLSRGWNQTELAEQFGVQQATISRWEAGRVVPDRAARYRLRAVLRAQDSKADQAIIQSVRYAHTLSGLSMVAPRRVIEASLGSCRLQGVSRADFLRIPLLDWFACYNPTPEAGWAHQNALKDGDVLAIQVTTEFSIFRTEERRPVITTFTPLWLSDGTFIVRSDSSVLSPGEYYGQSVTAITHDDVACEL